MVLNVAAASLSLSATVGSKSSALRWGERMVYLPIGYKFRPTDVELLAYFLRNKVRGQPLPTDIVKDMDVFDYHPKLLPRNEERFLGDKTYFFVPTGGQEKMINQSLGRCTPGGYWKVTGSTTNIVNGRKIIGSKKILVFYCGKAPYGRRTGWMMDEYRLNSEADEIRYLGHFKDNHILCGVYKRRSRPKPRKKSHRGVPSNVGVKRSLRRRLKPLAKRQRTKEEIRTC